MYVGPGRCAVLVLVLPYLLHSRRIVRLRPAFLRAE
ncbi:predicted protein [Plenodomus lingam JN3]|uniref:Uncharacterized protein n=1 Tax=Leptosphaeria maculans (strain JN3 / isolate v23.1.3 / race Av1-4-5-6-7-8) TaxID=985895 RepID=E4ZFU8_LEPMJ|nr:predicted protein [Plenodomus lingam JN3]CBX90168.1 predicted protein [Plenodomus lingam JN3]